MRAEDLLRKPTHEQVAALADADAAVAAAIEAKREAQEAVNRANAALVAAHSAVVDAVNAAGEIRWESGANTLDALCLLRERGLKAGERIVVTPRHRLQNVAILEGNGAKQRKVRYVVAKIPAPGARPELEVSGYAHTATALRGGQWSVLDSVWQEVE